MIYLDDFLLLYQDKERLKHSPVNSGGTRLSSKLSEVILIGQDRLDVGSQLLWLHKQFDLLIPLGV